MLIALVACQSSPNLVDWFDWAFQMSDFRSGLYQKKHVILTHLRNGGILTVRNFTAVILGNWSPLIEVAVNAIMVV